MTLLEKIEFQILRENWSGHDTYIYRIQPIGDSWSKLEKHPTYKSYSIISNKEFVTGQVVTADLKTRRAKDGSINYVFVKESISFPKTADAQWEFLERIANNHSFKRVYKALLSNLSSQDLVLEYIMNHPQCPDIMDEKYESSYLSLRETIGKYQQNAIFIEAIPKEVSELLSDSMIEKLTELEADAKTSAKRFLHQPFEAIRIDGIGFKTVDKIRERLHTLYPNDRSYAEDNSARVYYGAYDILDRNMIKSGDTYITLDDLKNSMINDLNISKDLVTNFLDRGYRTAPLIMGMEVERYGDKFTTKNILTAESTVHKALIDNDPVEPDLILTQAIENYIQNSGIEFSQEQIQALRSIPHHKINILSGGGGTGKTWLVSHLINIYESVYPKSTLLTAPTGKAAHVLSTYTGMKATTIHKAFHVLPSNNEIHAFLDRPYRLMVFDESSMIDTVLMANILHAINNHQTNYPVQIVLIGDPYQLPSVGPGNILHSLLAHKTVNITTLTNVYRVGDIEGGISKLSTSFRNGMFPFKAQSTPQVVGNDLVLQHIQDMDQIHDRVLKAYYHLLKNDNAYPEDIMVLTPQNKGMTGQAQLNVSIQQLVREYFQRDEESYLSRKIYGVETEFYPDDLIIFNRNTSYPIKNFLSEIHQPHFVDDQEPKEVVNNGDIGIIDDADDQGLIITLLNKKQSVYVNKSELIDISLGYAFTIHKSQGSQSAYGIMAIAPKDYYSLNANILYTGVSRFINKLYLFGSFKVIHGKVSHFLNNSRKTLLEEWLAMDETSMTVLDTYDDNIFF